MRRTSRLARRGGRPFVNVDISLPEARRTLEAFAKDRAGALEAFGRDIRQIASDALNQILNAEMNLFLGQPSQKDNRRNGHQRLREYHLKGFGGLRVQVPRDRKGRFSSVVVPAHERMDPQLRQDLAMLHLAGLSNRMLASIAKRLLGIDVSKDTISSTLTKMREPAEKWLTRPLTERYWALYVDGTNFKMQRRGSTETEPTLVVLGVNEHNRRVILAVEPGTKEDVGAWRAVFRDLKRRGLDPTAVRIGVMDGLPGLENLFRDEFPKAVTARCWLHALRNAREKTPARLREPFKQLAQRVMYASSEDAAREAFDRLKKAMNGDARRAVACLEKDLDSLLVYYRFDKRFWLALRTTNAIERFHRELKRRTKSMDALGEDSLMVVVAFTALRLQIGWNQRPIDSRAAEHLTAEGRGLLTAGRDVDDAVSMLTASDYPTERSSTQI